ncbi:MAG TPA: aspartate aminotransferase family protein [Xanthomonadales bacterium]|nr:aspartate aminotransferase family protein [Xanthomonadales bacterium]
MRETPLQLPSEGQAKDSIIGAMQAARWKDVNWRAGKAFSLVFQTNEEIAALLKEVYSLFFSENGLNPSAFPSLRKFETEVVAMSAALLGGDGDAAGNMTSGGTESILLAVMTAREWARAHRADIERPEMVLPVTAHPAFEKAAHYFEVRPVYVPVGPDFRADVEAMRGALTPQTALVVASAPSYPHGVVDPVAEVAKIAEEAGILCHVDACVGGFMLPFIRQLGYPAPDFDFRVPGVTSMSADLHKYGYAAKGASVILYKDAGLRRHQYFAATEWPGGIYASPTMSGTRPGGAIAAAWAVMNYLGQEGYLAMAEEVMRTTRKIQEGIAAIPGLMVLSNPEMSVFAVGSERLNIYEVGDEMSARGWHLDRQQFPASLHMTVHAGHSDRVDEFLADLETAARVAGKPGVRKAREALMVSLARGAARVLPEKWVSRLMARASSLVGVKGPDLPQRSAAMYGMMGSLPNRGDLREVVVDLLEEMTTMRSGEN